MSNNRYKRDGRADILDIYFGKDSEQRSSLLIILKNKPHIKIKSKFLSTELVFEKIITGLFKFH